VETRALYYTDSYLRSFRTTVLAVEGTSVALAETAFYPGGGGQPADRGAFSAGEHHWPVLGLARREGLIWHELDCAATGGAPPAVGATVQGHLDWERRYTLMRTHTAMHIFCGVIWHGYGAKVTGNNMEPGRGRLDLEFESMRAELVREIETKINAEVGAARPIKIAFLPRAEADQRPDLIRTKVNLLPLDITVVRTVEIVGLDLQADGGTHVANTSEVGPIRIRDYKSKGRINKRIEFELTPVS
jgi:misacylated tRNA(Ala) deacylase